MGLTEILGYKIDRQEDKKTRKTMWAQCLNRTHCGVVLLMDESSTCLNLSVTVK